MLNVTYAQEENKDYGTIRGNFQVNMQSYNKDSIIGATKPDEKVLANAYTNLIYTKGKFEAGVRYEAYLNTMLGYDSRYDGQGLAYKYATYSADRFEFTAGNFYEQFGNGLILRTYEDKTLGYDNAFEGFRTKIKPIEGITLTGLIGRQKKFFELGPGIVRAVDADLSINQIFKKLADKKTKFNFGGSFVSKYQKANDPVYNYPENVGAYAGRATLSRSGFVISGEYAYKMNDPSGDNFYKPENSTVSFPIFKDGNAIFLNASYSKKGIGVVVSAIRSDNMSFRSDRFATISDLNINSMPAISKTQTYSLAAMYPFASQPLGQAGANIEVFYKLKRKSLLGGKYGTNISLNYSHINNIKIQEIAINPENPDLNGYRSDPFSIGDELYFREFNIKVSRKLSKSFKVSGYYIYQDYNKDVLQGVAGYGIIHSNIGVLDVTYKINSKNALRLETEVLLTEQDYGDWGMLLAEYTFSPHWSLAIEDQYNYGNPDEDHKVHYFNVSAGYVTGGSRIRIGYGKQREGITCVGGVCRNVPASNGFSLSLSSSF